MKSPIITYNSYFMYHANRSTDHSLNSSLQKKLINGPQFKFEPPKKISIPNFSLSDQQTNRTKTVIGQSNGHRASNGHRTNNGHQASNDRRAGNRHRASNSHRASNGRRTSNGRRASIGHRASIGRASRQQTFIVHQNGQQQTVIVHHTSFKFD